MATTIAETERQFGMDTSVEDSLRELKFGLVEVVYEWARGMVREHHYNRPSVLCITLLV